MLHNPYDPLKGSQLTIAHDNSMPAWEFSQHSAGPPKPLNLGFLSCITATFLDASWQLTSAAAQGAISQMKRRRPARQCTRTANDPESNGEKVDN